MEKEIHIILQAILDEQKETRNDIKEIISEMATKEDLRELNSQIDAQVEKCQIVQIANDKNTEFRQTFVGGARWFAGSILVALLGLFSSIAVASSHATPPTVVSEPHIVVQSIHPPQPGKT
jgi:hypothetical protein